MTLRNSWPGVTTLATTTDGRKDLAALLARDTSGNARAGIVPAHANALVTSRGDMNVDIALFNGVAVQFGGPLLVCNDSTINLPSVLVSPLSGTNFYVVYAKWNESTSPGTDANNNTVIGTVLSTSSFATARASGTRMDASGTGLPTGAVELATVEVPTGKTATNNAGVLFTPTFQYTAVANAPVWLRNSTEETAWSPAAGSLGYRMDTSSLRIRGASSWSDLTPAAYRHVDTTKTLVPYRIERGRGKITGNNSQQVSEGVTFNTAFPSPPHVNVTFNGRRSTGAFNDVGLSTLDELYTSAQQVSTTGFTAWLTRDSSSGMASSSDYYYNWIAIGDA